MARRQFCYLYVTCKDSVESTKIAKTLLEKQLIACAKQMPVQSAFFWHGKVRHDDETLLIMEGALDLFDEVEKEIGKLHSYDTFVLEAVKVEKVSKRAQKWMEEELKNG